MDGGISPRATSDDDLKLPPQGGDRNRGDGRTVRWRVPGRGEPLQPATGG
jgi:hypothetical protein